jgi:hypothetical protein
MEVFETQRDIMQTQGESLKYLRTSLESAMTAVGRLAGLFEDLDKRIRAIENSLRVGMN